MPDDRSLSGLEPRHSGGSLSGSRATFSAEEKRRIFKRMVVSELEGGLLRYTRRQRLLRYAESLGIPAFEASLLIAEAQFHAAQLQPRPPVADSDAPLILRPNSWPMWAKVGFAMVVAAIIDVILIRALSL